jgi:hypothetical protein
MRMQVDFHVVRENGKDLLPQHMEALDSFIESALPESLKHGGPRKSTKEALQNLRNLNSARWEVFWKNFKEKKGWGDDVENPAVASEAEEFRG